MSLKVLIWLAILGGHHYTSECKQQTECFVNISSILLFSITCPTFFTP